MTPDDKDESINQVDPSFRVLGDVCSKLLIEVYIIRNAVACDCVFALLTVSLTATALFTNYCFVVGSVLAVTGSTGYNLFG